MFQYFNSSKSHEILGLQCEVVGLVFMLVGIIWQISFTDTIDKGSRKSIDFIQENVNIALLESIDNISRQINEDNIAKRQEIRSEIYDTTVNAIVNAVDMREQSEKGWETGLAKLFKIVRYIFVVLGSALIVVGKLLVLNHKRNATT